MISIIVALTSARVIGKDDFIPWRIPEELELFKKITANHTVIMGRKTFQSVSKLLPFRRNIIISKTIGPVKGADISRNIPEAIKKAEKYGGDIFIIGGESIYAQTLPVVGRLYVSWIHENYKGNKYFPVFNLDDWEIKETRTFRDFTFRLYWSNTIHKIHNPYLNHRSSTFINKISRLQRMIPIAKPIIGAEEKRAVIEVLDSGMLAQGKKVAEFEQEFARFIGVKHAIATSNGTTALHAALLAHGIQEGDEVITPTFSFVATANAIRMCSATPVFVDIDEKTFNINSDQIEAAITPKTKAILPAHLFGLPAEMDKIKAIAQKHNLFIIEDACQAHGAVHNGKKVGSFGTGCFSFYATKNMTTGEGGMITTNGDEIAAKLRKIINHGSERRYFHDMLGYNYRMTDLAAAIGIEQLQKLESFNLKRKDNARYLNLKLQNLSGLILPPQENHVFHQYTIRITNQKRDKIKEYLEQKKIGTAIFYPLPIHTQKAFPEYHHLSFPAAEKASREVLSLPIHPSLTIEELDLISEALKEGLEKLEGLE